MFPSAKWVTRRSYQILVGYENPWAQWSMRKCKPHRQYSLQPYSASIRSAATFSLTQVVQICPLTLQILVPFSFSPTLPSVFWFSVDSHSLCLDYPSFLSRKIFFKTSLKLAQKCFLKNTPVSLHWQEYSLLKLHSPLSYHSWVTNENQQASSVFRNVKLWRFSEYNSKAASTFLENSVIGSPFLFLQKAGKIKEHLHFVQ